MRNGELTALQRQALAFRERAKAQGMALSAYCRKERVSPRRIYDALALLRRQGRAAAGPHAGSAKFMAVKIMPAALGSAAVCRIVMTAGLTLECTQWPPRSWLASLSDAADAAP